GDEEMWKRDFPSVRHGCGEYQARLTLINDAPRSAGGAVDWYMSVETRVCNRCEDDKLIRLLDLAHIEEPSIDLPAHDLEEPTDTMIGFPGHIGVQDPGGAQYMLNCGADKRSMVESLPYRL